MSTANSSVRARPEDSRWGDGETGRRAGSAQLQHGCVRGLGRERGGPRLARQNPGKRPPTSTAHHHAVGTEGHPDGL